MKPSPSDSARFTASAHGGGGQTRTYTTRPPATARAARRAWDLFQRTRATPHRPITELFYSPNYCYDGPHWVCQIGMLDTDTMHWAFRQEDLMYAVPASMVADL